METVPFVLKASLEKEKEQQQQQKWCLEEEGEISIDSDWIREFMNMSDEELDKVVVLGEVNKPEAKSKSSISKLDVIRVDDEEEEEEEEDDDDDDCVVLDCDPESLVTSVKDSPTESDELVVVGEKGQNACRDYPHPRHLCANVPYSSSPHEKHCGQCHCYVCDSPAPCLKWGTGISTSDHCHASDKSEMWKTLRENFKLGIQTAPLSASTNHGTLTGDVGNPHHNHFLPLDITRLSTNSMLINQNQTSRSTSTHPFSVNLIPQNQASRPTITRARSSLTSGLQNQFSTPNTVPGYSTDPNVTILHGANHGRCQELGSSLVRNRYQSHSVPKQWLGVQSHAIQKARMMSNRVVGSVGGGSTLKMNHFTHNASGFSNHVNPARQYDRRYHAATGFSIGRTCYGENNVWIPNANDLLHPQQPSSELTSLRYVSKYSSPSENQAFYQPSDSRNFCGYSIQGTNDALSSYVAGLNRNQHLNEHQIGSQNVNAGGNIIHCGATMQDGGQSEYARKAGFLAFDSSWAKNTSQNISYLQSLGSMNIPPLNAKESGTQFTVNTGLSVDDINHWLFDEDNSHS